MAGKKSTPATREKRGRIWTAIVYPESAPDGWEAILDGNHIEWACSPLHDSDLNADGTPKKPHWHIVLSFDGVKSYEQVSEITKALNAPIPQRCESVRGIVRYLVHLDNPDKHQYARADIRVFGGFDAAEYLKSSEEQRGSVIRQMCTYIMENDIREFFQLSTYAMENEPDWWEALTTNSAYFIDKFISSWRNSR